MNDKKNNDVENYVVPSDLVESYEEDCVSVIFNEPPTQWGLRGDPYVWRELENHFSTKLLPCSIEFFIKEFHSAFEKFTDCKLDAKGDIFVPRYDQGGMSSGMVSIS